MDFELTAEESLVRSTTREFLAARADLRRARARIDDPDEAEEAALWRELTDKVDLPGLALPAEYGGGDGSVLHLALVFEEMGAVLLDSPYYATIGLAGQALLAAGGDDARARILPRIAAGELRATVAFGDTADRIRADAVPVTATAGPDGWTLRGRCRFVVDGDRAELVLVVARTPEGLGLFGLDGDGPGVARHPVSTIDPTRGIGSLELADAPVALVSPGADATAGIERAFALAQVVSAAEQLGAAGACLAMSVEHATTRTQFGRPIATFQAVKHKCADVLLELEATRLAVYYAAWVAAAAPDELGTAAREARAATAAALSLAAATNIQVHGGIGYTWEHDAHLFFRRAKAAHVL